MDAYNIGAGGYIFLFVILLFSFFWLFMYLDVKGKKSKAAKISRYRTVAIMIPTINEGKFIRKTVTCALDLDYPASKYTIYIALNKSSTKDTIETARSVAGSRVKAIECPVDGKSKVMNYVLKKFIKEDILLILDADTLVNRSLLKRAVPFFDDENVGAVVSSVKVLNPKSLAQKLQYYEYLLSIISRKVLSSMAALMVTHGAGSAFRTSIIRKVGYFDDSGNPTEDLEIGLRLLLNGYAIETDPTAISYTAVPKDFAALFEQRKRWFSGFFVNIIKYRKELFSRKHARLGFFVLPIVLFSTVLGIALIFELAPLIYTFISNEYAFIINTSLSFAVSSQINNSNVLFGVINQVFILSIAVSILGVIAMYYALRYSGIKLNRYRDTAGMIGYIFFYSFFLSFVWLYAALNMAITRKGYVWKIAT